MSMFPGGEGIVYCRRLTQWFLTFFTMMEPMEFYMIFEEHNRKIKQYFYMHNVIENYIYNILHILINRK